MKYVLLIGILAANAALAQTASSGVLQEWEVQKLMQNLEAQTKRLPAVIGQIKPDTWMAKGAPETYLAQWTSSQAELKYLLASSDALIKQPERLTVALETYFRMQAMDTMLVSLIEGIRKYQNPALAELVQGVVDENSANRDKLRQYIQDLAAQKEQEFAVADKEAQRCRATLMRQQAPPGRKNQN